MIEYQKQTQMLGCNRSPQQNPKSRSLKRGSRLQRHLLSLAAAEDDDPSAHAASWAPEERRATGCLRARTSPGTRDGLWALGFKGL